MLWLERAQQAKVERIVTVGYFAVVKIDAPQLRTLDQEQAIWCPVDRVGNLAFDHNLIIDEALKAFRREADFNRSMIFDLLPRKFTATELRLVAEIVQSKPLDVRNFHKKIAQMPYVVPLDERQKGVAHRAARYYKFDRKIFNTSR